MTGIVEFMVGNFQEIQALAGIIFFSLTTHYSYRIVQNLNQKQEYALARFFLKRKTSRSFWVISVSALILSFGMALKNIGMITGQDSYIALSLLSHILMLFGLTYFTFNIFLITKPNLDHNSSNVETKSEEESQSENEDVSDGSEKDSE